MCARIATGLKMYEYSTNKDVYIYYKCHNCNRNHLYKYNLKYTSRGTYHIFNSNENIYHKISVIQDSAKQEMKNLDDKYFRAFNEEHTPDVFPIPVKCPDCYVKQLWSAMPKQPGKRYLITTILLYIISISILIYSIQLSPFYNISRLVFMELIFTYFTIALIVPPFRYIRRMTIFDKYYNLNLYPVYINDTNMHILNNIVID